MAALTPLLLAAMMLLVKGIWDLSLSVDDLWERQERVLLARGLAPQRNGQWEKSARQSSWSFIGMGIVALLMYAYFANLINSHQPMSGYSINNHELTRAEYDACGHNDIQCLQMYAQTYRAETK